MVHCYVLRWFGWGCWYEKKEDRGGQGSEKDSKQGSFVR